ncbi:MAG TPA: sugar nucleotide-binding protein [Candidatus Nanoarchaeia archaeon]|nr:sugar nucleotide-binding protein [Candidatus Nanoarchaeia archaeon]
MKKILILGGSGFIGTKIVERLQSTSRYEITSTYHHHLPKIKSSRWIKLDLYDLQQLQEILTTNSPDIIINLVTYSPSTSHVDACEKNPVQCSFINTSPTTIIAAYCHKNPKVKYIFFSSSQVFSGNKRHQENEIPQPKNRYGQTKRRAENIIVKLPNYAIVRPCVVYGIPLPFQHGNIFNHMYKTIRQGKEFTAYTDMIRSPCYVQDVVKLVEKIISQDARGIFHVPSESTSIYEFAKAITTFFKLDARYLTLGSAAKEPPYRVRNTSLDSTYTQKKLLLEPTPWNKAFAQMQEELA